MDSEEFKAIRKRLQLDRNEMAKLLALSGYMAVSNIEGGSRNPNRLAIKLLRYIDSMTKTKAKQFIEEINRYQPK